MHIYPTLGEWTVRSLHSWKIGRTGLTVIDNELPALALKVSKDGHRSTSSAARTSLADHVLGTPDEITVEKARKKTTTVKMFQKWDTFLDDILVRH